MYELKYEYELYRYYLKHNLNHYFKLEKYVLFYYVANIFFNIIFLPMHFLSRMNVTLISFEKKCRQYYSNQKSWNS